MMKEITSENYKEKKINTIEPSNNILFSVKGELREHSNQEKNNTDISNKMNSSNISVESKHRFKQSSNSSNWVNKIASGIDEYNYDLFDVLCQYDTDNDGFLSHYELKLCLLKLGIKLNEEDSQNLIAYYESSGKSKISIQEFCKMFAYKKKRN